MDYNVTPLKKDLSYTKILNNKFTWVDLKNLKLDKLCGWSIDYQTYLILMNFLNFAKPKAILELGFGFSSLLIDQYAKYFNAKHDICENDPEWIRYFQDNYCIDQKFNIILKDILTEKIQNFKQCIIYQNFTKDLMSKYDFVLVDGPKGCNGMSRANIYQNLELLNKHGSIIIHDTHRAGEKILAKYLLDKLPNYGIKTFERCSLISPVEFFKKITF